MATTEGIGGPCPRCGCNHCHIRYGSGTWYTFIACPDCGFGYGENADTMDETNGVVTGIDVFQTIMAPYHATSAEGLREIAEDVVEDTDEEELIDAKEIFDFSDAERSFMNACVVSENAIDRMGEYIEQRGD